MDLGHMTTTKTIIGIPSLKSLLNQLSPDIAARWNHLRSLKSSTCLSPPQFEFIALGCELGSESFKCFPGDSNI